MVLLKNFFFFLILTIFISACGKMDDREDFNLELSTCQPRSFINFIEEKLSPLKFWVKVVVDIDLALENIDIERYPLHSPKNRCNVIKDMVNHENCLRAQELYLQSIQRCLVEAKRLCIQNGGNCYK
jgi:hypothetical protein